MPPVLPQLRATLTSVWFIALKTRRHLRTRLIRTRKALNTQLKRPKKAVLHQSHEAQRSIRRGARTVGKVVRRATSVVESVGESTRDLFRIPFYSVPGEARTCPACGSDRLRLLDVLSLVRNIEGRRYGFVGGCEECGLAFANPVQDVRQLESLYAEEGRWAESRIDRRAPGDPSSKSITKVFSGIGDDLDVLSPPRGAAVLDIGCGDGRLLNGLQRFGWKTFGIEPAIKIAFQRHTELRQVPEGAQFQLVVLRHVLEHLRDPLDMLRRVERALVPGGYVFISVPNLDALPARGDYRYCISDRPHVSAFTRACLATLLARAGLHTITPRNDHFESLPRMELIARKEAITFMPEANPLAAAVTVFNGFRRRHVSTLESLMPIRLRAGLLNDRRASTLRRRVILVSTKSQ